MDTARILMWLQLLFRIVLAAVLAFAGILKLIDNTALFETVAYITWLPVWVKSLIIDFLPWTEIALAVLLLLKWQFKYVLPFVTLIFLGFFGFAIYGFATGMEGDCGCFGDLADSSFGWGMIFRNAAFAAMAGFLFYNTDKSKNLSEQ
ncbi:MAG: MauE/DoxX family redox-associated membrane protein [Balneolaceae bacterium]